MGPKLLHYAKTLSPALLVLGPVGVAVWQAKSPTTYHMALIVLGTIWAILNKSIADPGVLSAGGGAASVKP